MKSYTLPTATFRRFKQPAETSDGQMIEVFFLPPQVFTSPADASEISEGSHIKLMHSMVYLEICGPDKTSGRFRVFPTEKARF